MNPIPNLAHGSKSQSLTLKRARSRSNSGDASTSYVDVDGLTIQNGYFGLHFDSGEHCVVRNCLVTNMWSQGILVNDSYSEIANNYVDFVGGQLSDMGGTTGIRRDWRMHCLYTIGEGFSIHNNFLGRAPSGSSAQLLCDASTAATTVFVNNVCYGGQAASIIAGTTNITATGNVFISPALTWRGGTPTGRAAGYQYGLDMFFDSSSGMPHNCTNAVFSGNYVEGRQNGLELWANATWPAVIDGFVLSDCTICSGAFDAWLENAAGGVHHLPTDMDGNQWGGTSSDPNSELVFDLRAGSDDYAAFLAWAQAHGYEQRSAFAQSQLIDPAAYDSALDGGQLTLEAAKALFREYAADRVDIFDDPMRAWGMKSFELGGTATADADGAALRADYKTYNAVAAVPLTISAQSGLLTGVINPNAGQGETLTAILLSGPANGRVSINPDGSFTYTSNADFHGLDTFNYLISDGRGGTVINTVGIAVS